MKLEKLNINKNKRIIISLVIFIVLIVTITLLTTRAKYRVTENIKLAEGTIHYNSYDFKIMAMYQETDNDYVEISSIPSYGYHINQDKSYCTLDNINKDNNAVLKTIGSNHTISNLSKNDKCYIYFDKNKINNISDIINTHNLAVRTDFSTTVTEDTTGTLFVAPDDYGNSYYYAGAVKDNWVKFGGYYWRIIRINGDGTLRLIYNGTTTDTTGETTKIGTSAFNTNYQNNIYAGFMYTNGEIHGQSTNSTIKNVLDSWYSNNLNSYASKIATGEGASFCNDRQPSTSNSSLNGNGGTGVINTYYAVYIRLYTNRAPTFRCADTGDRFATSAGLITADEVAYAGGVLATNNLKYYLTSGYDYWTISVAMYNDGIGMVRINGDGWITDNYAPSNYGVRPVINLRKDIQFTGLGTADNPYVVS